MDNQYLFRLGVSLQNVRRMIKDRGYEIGPILQDPYEVASQLYCKAIERGISLGDAAHETFKGPKGKLSLWCLDRNYDVVKSRERMISMDQMKIANDLISRDNADVHILLLPHKQSPQAKREPCAAQIFLFTEMSIDLPRHRLVVPHIPVSENDAKLILGDKLDIRDLPVMPSTDPISKWFGFEVGTVVYIKNPIMPSFRCVK
jgi:DNA-directed RNA polymerase subunit H (RpoH/RPB5)